MTQVMNAYMLGKIECAAELTTKYSGFNGDAFLENVRHTTGLNTSAAVYDAYFCQMVAMFIRNEHEGLLAVSLAEQELTDHDMTREKVDA